MAKPVRAGISGNKKPRHTPEQKKIARQAREKQARAQMKGPRSRPTGDGSPRVERERTGYPRRDRDDRPAGGGYERREGGQSSSGGYQRRDRDDRGQSSSGGYQRRDRDDRSGGAYRGRDDRPQGGFPRRDNRTDNPTDNRTDRASRPRWADEDRSDWRDQQREREARGERVERREHTWRARRDDREGRPTERGFHEGRSWDENRRREDRFSTRDRDTRQREPVQEQSFGEDDREAAETAYQEHIAASAAKDVEVDAAEVAENGFAQLGLNDALVTALARTGITQPFPIQTATIPDALAGKDLLGRGQTGSGKTMAFGLPMLHRLAQRPRAVPHRPRALIVTPTRELAMQIVDALAPLMRSIDKRFLLVAGGMSYTPQLAALDRGVDVLVATPGRLIDLIERTAVDLREIEVVVLDEADHMAEMGFVEAIRQILDLTPSDGQRLLFSATLDHGVDAVAKAYLHDPVTHSTDDVTASVSTMDHHIFLVHPHHKKPITAAIANRPGRTIVFCRTKLGADRIAMQLRESGVFAAALHGGLNQAQRTRVLDAFKTGNLPVLVATDVAARGIHVDNVSLILQVDPPADPKDYLHRSGRTARAGDTGVVVTLALPHQKKQVRRLLEAAGVQTEPEIVTPEDVAIIETAGGSVPQGEPILQSQLDQILRPRRPQGRGGSGQRGRGGYGNREGGRPQSGGYRGKSGTQGGRGDSGGYGGTRRRDADGHQSTRPDWRPRD